MNRTIRGHNLRTTMVLALIAALFVVALIFALQPTVTTGDSEATPATSAGGSGGSSIDRQAKLIDRCYQSGPC